MVVPLGITVVLIPPNRLYKTIYDYWLKLILF